eukprot:8067366-Ditylum_brightwellii.AAC.1
MDMNHTNIHQASGNINPEGILGTLLFYARAVNPAMFMAINTIAAHQAYPMINTMADMVHLLNCCSTHPDAVP